MEITLSLKFNNIVFMPLVIVADSFFYESLSHRVPFKVLSETHVNIFMDCTESLHLKNQIKNEKYSKLLQITFTS